ncbi:DnaB-like helicase C-terminal domain-containing protein [Pseudomonas viridiflava]|uniref:DnaB-like helicase C-terminal domain-containing protein n=1 Tax=Pseudomonas viridiflava TaxID=33069 RepID=UPI002EA47101|nr:DnaB-like helicase C-terminal domain-containing protein [Pseudomonas viridiflava]
MLERSALRRVVAAADVIRDSASDSLPVAEIIAMAQQATADLRDLGAPDRKDYYKYSEVLTPVIDGIDSRFNGAKQLGHSTGLKDLDELIRGLRNKNMIVIAGLPGSGKTTLGVQIAQKIACVDNGVGLIVSMEMTRDELVTRGIASVGGVSLTRLDEGHASGRRLRSDDLPPLLLDLAERIERAPLESMLALMMPCHGTRLGETRLARWKNLNLTPRQWFIPVEDTRPRRNTRCH